MAEIQLADFRLLAPEIFLSVCGLVLLVLSAVGRGLSHRSSVTFVSVSLALTAALVWWVQGQTTDPSVILAGMFRLDGFAFFWWYLFLIAAGLTVALSARFLEDGGYRAGEYYSLLVFATVGMMFMAGGFNLVSIWIGLELMALSSYVLVGYFKRERRSIEGALKYFVLGVMSSAMMLYGMSLLYGATGELQLDLIAAAMPQAVASSSLLVTLGWLMMAVGLFFKVAAVPFHVWTPDVYVGAPTPITSYLAAASKAASFAILVRIFYQALPDLMPDWQVLMAAVSVLTMVWGNLAALTQDNVKRMLAYSSIAHAGYILMGVLAASVIGGWSVLFYLLAYVLITVGVFATVILLESGEYAGETYSDYAGLAKRSPALAAAMLVFMLALTGIPPTGGFVGKVYLFAAAIEAGWTWVAVIGVLTSAVSLYYYFGIVVQMYLKESDRETRMPLRSPALLGAIAVCVVGTLLLGLFPGPFIDLARDSVLALP
jgi:NADH-quinone oxidoreductase subunit N